VAGATDAWPGGFRAAANQTLADWEEISGEATRGHPEPSGGGRGGSAEVDHDEREGEERANAGGAF
jgi:hypothetical protein